MCGIFFSLSTTSYQAPNKHTKQLLHQRGPDHYAEHTIRIEAQGIDGTDDYHVTLAASVLALRGGYVQQQPLVDEQSGSVFCWNGDAWRLKDSILSGNDTVQIFDILVALTRLSSEEADRQISSIVSSIEGPFAFVFYDANHTKVYFGRDYLGRRSLVQRFEPENRFLAVASLAEETQSKHWQELDTDGIHCVNFSDLRLTSKTISWPVDCLPSINRHISVDQTAILTLASSSVANLENQLLRSLALRISHLSDPTQGPPQPACINGSRLAILFSGGLDCTLLARLSHKLLPPSFPIDLLNVAFENPRIFAGSQSTDAYSLCPDRQTGLRSHTELQRLCPARLFRFVSINVPYSELLTHRPMIKALMSPHITEMDLSIATALYFAARGSGMIVEPTTNSPTSYTTPARVLLSGLGADELFGGYTRHATAFSRRGYSGLIDELDLDTKRLGQRNLGRDDRVISHWGRQARYPFLDERFMAWAIACPVWEKCGFGEQENEEVGRTEHEADAPVSLDPAKKVLRLLAWKLGLKGAAREKKRAIQFGARTAKMEPGKKKGTDILI